MTVLLSNEDYVIFYARKLKEDKEIFKQQKMLIDSQMKSSKEIFKKKFEKDFKKNAMIYLRAIGLLE